MIAVIISLVGSVIVWLRHRQPNDPLGSVDDFQREMQALGSTPPSVADGPFEVRPRGRMNTVSLRPNDPLSDGAVGAVADGDPRSPDPAATSISGSDPTSTTAAGAGADPLEPGEDRN